MEMEVEYFNISRYIIGRIRFRPNRYRFRGVDNVRSSMGFNRIGSIKRNVFGLYL